MAFILLGLSAFGKPFTKLLISVSPIDFWTMLKLIIIKNHERLIGWLNQNLGQGTWIKLYTFVLFFGLIDNKSFIKSF